MTYLIYFILGVIFINLILPILEGVASLIVTKFEVYKAQMAVDINKYNLMIENEGNTPTDHTIGFVWEPEEELEEEIIDD